MFNFFQSIIAKIVVGISTVAIFFSGGAATPPVAPQNATSSAQVEVVATSSTTVAPTTTTEPSAKHDAPQEVSQPIQQKVEAPKTSVVTLPSGAVVEMDANGNIVRTIKDAPAQTATQVVSTSSAQTTVPQTQTLSVKLGVVTITRPGKPGYAPYHAHIEWSTNIPTNSKIFFAPTGQWQNVNPDGSVNSNYFLVPAGNPLFGYSGATTAVMVNSTSGYSTMHSVDLNNLQEKYQYSYTIEATSGTLDQKITGTFDTK